jgi:hypothetical protein
MHKYHSLDSIPNASTVTNGFDIYTVYMAVYLHFNTEKYNFLKYYGKSKCSVDAYEKASEKNRLVMERLGKKLSKEDLRDYLISNHVESKIRGTIIIDRINDLYNPENFEVYEKWKNVHDSLIYTIEKDFYKIQEICNARNKKMVSFLKSNSGEIPELVRMCMNNEIHIETMTLLDRATNFMEKADVYEHDPLWEKTIFVSHKYKIFFNSKNVADMKKLVKDYFL